MAGTADIAWINMITYATWNNADKDAAITLSNGFLDVASSSTFVACRGNLGKVSGKWYWEIKFKVGGGAIYGVANLSANINSSFDFGANVNSSGLISNDAGPSTISAQNGSYSAALYSSNLVANDIVSCAYDADGNSLVMRINNVVIATLSGINTGTMYPYIGYWDTAGTTFTTNFGQTAWAFTPPVGYTGLH